MNKPTKRIVVDGSTRGNPGPSFYKLVDLQTNKVIFDSECIGITTNNVTEFIALCHAIYYVDKNKLDIPIYSDSQTAISWVKNKKVNSSCVNLSDRIKKAEKYLSSINEVNIDKWHTSIWGENPADFGLKNKTS